MNLVCRCCIKDIQTPKWPFKEDEERDGAKKIHIFIMMHANVEPPAYRFIVVCSMCKTFVRFAAFNFPWGVAWIEHFTLKTSLELSICIHVFFLAMFDSLTYSQKWGKKHPGMKKASKANEMYPKQLSLWKYTRYVHPSVYKYSF